MKEVFSFIKKYNSFIFFIIIVVLSILLFDAWSTIKQERAERKYKEEQDAQNRAAMIDSISVMFNKKLKAWEYSKDNFVVQRLNDLEKYDKSFTDELKKVKGDVIAAIKTEVQGNLGGIEASTKLSVLDLPTNYYGLKFKSEYFDEGFEQKITGMSKFHVIPNEKNKTWNIVPDPITVLDTNFVAIKMTYGFKETKNQYQVFATTKSDKIKVTGLEGGYIIDKQPLPGPVKPKKWSLGPYVGYGLSADPNNTAQFGWNIGFGIHYNIIRW